jgi:hypothetical protein
MEGTILRIHNSILDYRYILNGKVYYSVKELIEKLASEAGYKVEHTGNGKTDYEDEQEAK